MRVAIIGGVAGGMGAATKVRRELKDAEIVVFEKGNDISYSACSLPYYISGDVKRREDICPRSSDYFHEKYNIEVKIKHEVLAIDASKRTLKVRDLEKNIVFDHFYDRLLLATGASPLLPPWPGIELPYIFSLRNVEDADRIKEYLARKRPQKAAVIGGGFMGLEMVEALVKMGMQVTLIDRNKQLLNPLDFEIALGVEKYLAKMQVEVILGEEVQGFQEGRVNLSSGRELSVEMVIIALGVKPNTSLAVQAGVELGSSGAIKVDRRMETNWPGIYAAGDCAEVYSSLLAKNIYRPQGSIANKTARVAGANISGANIEFPGVLGTSIFKLFDLTIALTGLTEKEAKKEGLEIRRAYDHKYNKPKFYPGSNLIFTKILADRKTGRILGAQMLGGAGVDKRIDVLATAMFYEAKAEDLFYLDLAYAPPYSTVKDPVAYLGMILEKKQ